MQPDLETGELQSNRWRMNFLEPSTDGCAPSGSKSMGEQEALGVEHPLVFFDIQIGEEQAGRVVVELWEHLFPSTVANFVAISQGTATGSSGRLLSYKGTRIHKVIRNFAIQGGDAVNNNGTGSDSIFGQVFPNEGPWLSHERAGLIGMASNGPNTNGCQFYITTVPNCTHLNGQRTVFGRVVRGMGVVKQVEIVRTHNDIPDEDVIIENSGIYQKGMLLGPGDPKGEDIYPPYPEDCPASLLNFRSLQDVVAASTRIKIVGNSYYKQQQIVKAHVQYQKALRYLNKYQDLAGEISPSDETTVTQAVLPNLLNSAACKIRLKMYDRALEECNEILESAPNNPKAFYRRGQAYHGKGDYDRAIKDLTMANKLVPGDPSVTAELKACRGEMATYCAKEKKACVKYFSPAGNKLPQDQSAQKQMETTQLQPQQQAKQGERMVHQASSASANGSNGVSKKLDAANANRAGSSGCKPEQAPRMRSNSDESDEMMS